MNKKTENIIKMTLYRMPFNAQALSTTKKLLRTKNVKITKRYEATILRFLS